MASLSHISPLRKCYLVLALLGALVPSVYFYLWFGETDGGVLEFVDALRVTLLARAAVMELLLSSVVLSIWIVAETGVRRNWSAFWAIPATLVFGISFGLPLYLFLRTRPV